jgi:hypothetical protein
MYFPFNGDETMRWLPIETAPKDGTRIDVFTFTTWDIPNPTWSQETKDKIIGRRECDAYWSSIDGEWRGYDGVGENIELEEKIKMPWGGYYRVTVTHWMPIPEDPPAPVI